jgi:hypothetical protein
MQDTTRKYRFGTAYSQFYLADKESPAATDSNSFWTEDAFADKLAVEEGILGVCTGTYSYVKCEVSSLAHRPDESSFDGCDQVVEASLELKSGVLQLLNCPDSTVIASISLPIGVYRVRVVTTGLESIIDEEYEANDKYLVELWPEPLAAREVLKRYPLPY